MNPLALVTPKITIGLAVALALSIGVNTLQWFSARTAAAECKAAAAQVLTDIATGTAKAEKDRADQIAGIALASSKDEADRLKALDDATKRITSAARGYAAAVTAKPLPTDCIADADRVKPVNEARGYK